MVNRPKAKDFLFSEASNDAENQSSASEQSSYESEEEVSRSSAIQARHGLDETSGSDLDEGDDDSIDGNDSNIDIVENEEATKDNNAEKSTDDEDYFIGDIDGDEASDDENSDDGNASDPQTPDHKKLKKHKPVTEKDIRKARKKETKSGVVYMSRVPPFMKPIKVRHLLQKYAKIGRIFLVEEDEQKRKRRIKSGGNRRRLFVEGWIEFENKKYAKAVANMLNSTPMGGKKHGFYHDDLWNLKYLPKFKWRHLAEQLANERAAKQQRLQSEINQSRRELDAYVKSVDRAKKIASIKSKREAKIKSGMDVKQLEDRSRNVWQRDVVVRGAAGKPDEQLSSASKRRKTQQSNGIANVLDQIF